MSWYTGYSKIKEDLSIANKIIAHAESLGLDIGVPVRYNGRIFKVKQLWVNTSGGIHIRVELDDPDFQDIMVDIEDIEYGPAIQVLFGE